MCDVAVLILERNKQREGDGEIRRLTVYRILLKEDCFYGTIIEEPFIRR